MSTMTFGPAKYGGGQNINPDQDKSVGGANSRMTVGCVTGKAADVQRLWPGFNISALPLGAAVSDATLALINTQPCPAGVGAHIYRVTQPLWVSDSSWNDYDIPNSHPWATAGGDYTTTGGVAFTLETTGAATLTIAGLGPLVIDAIANRSALLDILMRVDNEAPSVNTQNVYRFDAGFEPVLTVTYTAAGGSSTVRRRGGVV